MGAINLSAKIIDLKTRKERSAPEPLRTLTRVALKTSIMLERLNDGLHSKRIKPKHVFLLLGTEQDGEVSWMYQAFEFGPELLEKAMELIYADMKKS